MKNQMLSSKFIVKRCGYTKKSKNRLKRKEKKRMEKTSS